MRTHPARAIAAGLLLIASFVAAAPAYAQPADIRTPITTEVPIPAQPELTPGSTPERVADYLLAGRVEDLAQYIGIIYNFLIGIVGMVAAVAMVIGGFQYLTSAGDSGKIGAAKTRMANAFIGLVLALGAYTILNTINPRLLALKLPDLRAVTTELFTLPWCEDIMAGDPLNNRPPTPVTPYGSGTGCGSAGKYKQGNSDQVCIYTGSIRIEDIGDRFGVRTCMQYSGVESGKVVAALAKDQNAKFAEFLTCGSLTKARARAMGFGDIQVACEGWEQALASVPASLKKYTRNGTVNGGTFTVENGFFEVCYPKVAKDGCVGFPMYCWDITRDDDSTGDNNDRELTGCEGYDESPDAVYGTDLDTNGFATKQIKVSDCGGGVTSAGCAGMEGFPVHLGTACAQNPCVNYLDPETGATPFINGCKSGSGLFNRVQRVVRYGDIQGINDCSCIVDDNKNCSGR